MARDESFDWASAGPDAMLTRLDELDADALDDALENDAFNEDHVKLLLKRPGLHGEMVERLSREARFFKLGAIRSLLVQHPKIPRVRALELVPYLYWRDALRVARSPRVHPQVRVVAERAVAERVPDLTLGERLTLARTATRPVLQALRSDPEPRVIASLLMNYRCTEEVVTSIAAKQSTPPEVLATIARHPKWKIRPQVRVQLVRNRRLGLPIALGLLEGLSQGELAGLARKGDLPKLLRDSAQRLLADSRRSRPRP